MRPHAYGGYCALDNNLPKPPPLHAYQHSQNSHQQHAKTLPALAAYARTTYPPTTTALHLQHQQHQHQHHQQQHLPNLAYQHNQHASLPAYHSSQNSAQYLQTRNVRTIGPPQLPPPSQQQLYRHHASNFNPHAATQNATPPQNQPHTQRLLPSELANAHNYAKLPPPDAVNQQRIHECAGIPLISAAYTQRQQQRLQRKPAATANPLVTNQASNSHWQPPQPPRETKHVGNIAQMAAHAQGSPILLPKTAPFWSSLHNQANNARLSPPTLPSAHSMQQFAHAKMPTDKSRLCYQHSAPPALSSSNNSCSITQNKENLMLQQTPSAASMSNSNSSATSSTNDELCSSKDSNDNCLPRIIKPRKRRKKDRKPANGVFLKLELELAAKTEHGQNILKHNNTMDFNYSSHKPQHGCPTHYVNLATTNEHQNVGNCFCSNCNPLRSIWEYPLRRSLSDTSNASTNENFMCFTKQNGCISPVLSTASSSSTSSAASSANSATVGSSSSSSTISLASFSALKLNKNAETENFSPITTESTRANIVGVIGSNRAHHHGGNSNNNDKHEQLATSRHANETNHLSDQAFANGYSDILGGINLADDLFKNVVASRTSSSSSLAMKANNENSTAENFLHSPLLLPTSAAERLLNASINEISRQLIETCINEPTTTTTLVNGVSIDAMAGDNIAFSTFSTCSDLSNDSGLDSAGSLPNSDEVIFKFDELNLNFETNNLNDNQQKSTNIANLCLDFNNNITTFKNEEQIQQTATTPMLLNQIFENDPENQQSQQFTQNCYELIWRDLTKMSNKNYDLNDTNAFSSVIRNASFSSISSK